MTNAEFYKNPARLRAAHEAFREAAKDFIESDWVRRAIEDPYFYATKDADTALQPELKVGSLVKVVTNLSGEGKFPHYAVVDDRPVFDRGNERVRCTCVTLRFGNGSTYNYEVHKAVFTALHDDSDMKSGDIKACDIPEEIIALVRPDFSKCPLKDEAQCVR